ncbi:prolyl oligopeptidase family serine peptidase [Humidisolicoccus flavus]|uniref:prolyl oligopeptidase family serine peptidase n=1 Tax=Humidisolicoccus flavus TaxID=3111414 RepID=UPI00324E3BBD
MRFPEVRRSATVRNIHGVETPDPYDWLEDADSPETAAFVAAQNAVSRPFLAALPHRAHFGTLVTELLTAPTAGAPWQRGERYFQLVNNGAQNHDVLVTAETVAALNDGEARVLLDPNLLSVDGTMAVTALSVSPDGEYLAFGVADGGSDWRTIHVIRVADGEPLGDVIPWTKWNPPAWLPGARAFTYWAYDAPVEENGLTATMGAGRLMRHELGDEVSRDTIVFSRPSEPRLFARTGPFDEHWFVVQTDTGSSSGNDLAVRAHDEPESALRQLVTGHSDSWHPVGIRGDVLFVLTDEAAPKYRLLSCDLNDGEWHEVIAEHDTDVLIDASLTKHGLVLTYSHDAAHRAVLASDEGELGDSLALGEGRSIVALHSSRTSNTVFAKTSGFVDRGERSVIEVDGAKLVSIEPMATLPGAGATAAPAPTRLWAQSADGEQIPAFVIRPEGVDTPSPTLIWAYGGFNIPMNPEFRAVLAAWVAAGGTLVVPNLRGGGEFGREWHEAGTKARKQNVFNDLYAIAEQLIAEGITTSEQLALHGRSNGGLLAGAALTQRPELWAAVLPGVGVLDMLRFHEFTIGWAWCSDYGDPAEADAAAYLRAYSPLHNVRAGVAYPPTLITTGDHDDRVVPAHSFKFAAALQHAAEQDAPDQVASAQVVAEQDGQDDVEQEGVEQVSAAARNASGPLLLAVDTRAGHGMGKPKTAAAAEFADQLAFAAHFTGLTPRSLSEGDER